MEEQRPMQKLSQRAVADCERRPDWKHFRRAKLEAGSEASREHSLLQLELFARETPFRSLLIPFSGSEWIAKENGKQECDTDATGPPTASSMAVNRQTIQKAMPDIGTSVFATTTKICTRGRSTRAHVLGSGPR
ncbi:hypothetical protein ACHAO4_006590 [Trichoderma viride]